MSAARLGLILAGAYLGFAPAALAHPPGAVRLPVDWTGAPCLSVIDRSSDPVHAFSYAIIGEDEAPTEDEPPDSHTHQFLAFCRDRDLLEPLPNWISQADVDTASDYGLVTGEVEASELLAANPDWAGCWSRILADEERRPITAEAAAEPVSWDTSMLAAGTYVIEGYTYEPPLNLWAPHPGVFKIVDDPDPAASGPAAALDFPEATKFVGSSVELSGCVDAMDGARMTLSWARYETAPGPRGETPMPSSAALEWEVLDADLPVENGAFSRPWVVPESAAGTTVLIKLDVVDPMGRSWTAHALNRIGVISIDGDGGTEGGETGETGAGLDEVGGGAEGCSCRSLGPRDAGPGPGLLALALLALAGWVRPATRQ